MHPWPSKSPRLRQVNLERDKAFGRAKIFGDKEARLIAPPTPRAKTEYATLPLSGKDLTAIADTLLANAEGDEASTHVGFTEDGRPYLYCDRPKARRIPRTKTPVDPAKVKSAREKATESTQRRDARQSAMEYRWDAAVRHNMMFHPEWFSVETLKKHSL